MDSMCKEMEEKDNKILSNVQLEGKFPNRSWYEDILESEKEDLEVSSTVEDHDKTMTSQSNAIENVVTNKSDMLEEIHFLDSSNEEKYYRLVKEEKIKTPIKRRYSSSGSTSRSNSPYEGESCGGTSVNSDDSNQRFCSKKSKVGEGKVKGREYEINEEILSRRQKQIEYGKNTLGYDIYVKKVPRNERTSDHPWTPPKNYKYSRRAFDGMIKVWRKKLHCYDPSTPESIEN